MLNSQKLLKIMDMTLEQGVQVRSGNLTVVCSDWDLPPSIETLL